VILTRFPSKDVSTGTRIETTWDLLAQFLCIDPPIERRVPKERLPLWSPATFKGDHRARGDVEAVYALGFDVDATPVPTEAELRAVFEGQACLFHLSSSATTAAPRWRLFLQLSRPVSASEYDTLWAVAARVLPFPVGREAKNPDRPWYLPRVPAEGEFVGVVMTGEPLDVDAVLAMAPAPGTAPAAVVPAPSATAPATRPAAHRRRAMALALGSAWPADGEGRNSAQLALAGGLRSEGWSAEDALVHRQRGALQHSTV
jgi:hypothetical protein